MHHERFVVFSKGICRRRGKPRRGEEKKVCCSSIESADVMRSSADDPFFRFFNSVNQGVRCLAGMDDINH